MAESSVPYIDPASAPEYFATGLHDVQVMGPVSRFILYTLQMSRDGQMARQAALALILPNEAVGPAISLTWDRMPSGVLVPALGQAVRRWLVH